MSIDRKGVSYYPYECKECEYFFHIYSFMCEVKNHYMFPLLKKFLSGVGLQDSDRKETSFHAIVKIPKRYSTCSLNLLTLKRDAPPIPKQFVRLFYFAIATSVLNLRFLLCARL